MRNARAGEPGSGYRVKPLLPLALATFAVGTDAFVIAGLLPAIAVDLEVSIAAAGQLVTVFALTLAVAAPVLSWLLSPLDRRAALQLALVVFIVGNVVTALSPTYPPALLARVLTALGAASITATASSAAVAVTPPERRGRAMASVIGGLTLGAGPADLRAELISPRAPLGAPRSPGGVLTDRRRAARTRRGLRGCPVVLPDGTARPEVRALALCCRRCCHHAPLLAGPLSPAR